MKFSHLVYRSIQKFVRPVVPRAQRLAVNYWACRLTGNVESELLNIRHIAQNPTAAIDVGANCGLWSYGMSRVFTRVHSFEANEEVAGDIKLSHNAKIQLQICGLSSREGEATLYIPLKDEIKLTGWASLQSGNCPETSQHIEKKVQLRTLDSFAITGVSFIKIDTEGHEVEVLRGGTQTMASNRPIAIIEVMDRNREEVTAYFQELNYEELPLDSPSHVEHLMTMRLYVPKPEQS